jgi:hypothetical protein
MSILVVMPPPFAFAPAALAFLAQIIPPVIGLAAVKTVSLDGFLELPFGAVYSALAFGRVARLRVRGPCEEQKTAQRGRSQGQAPKHSCNLNDSSLHDSLPVAALGLVGEQA